MNKLAQLLEEAHQEAFLLLNNIHNDSIKSLVKNLAKQCSLLALATNGINNLLNEEKTCLSKKEIYQMKN